jgi:hypothetical protein
VPSAHIRPPHHHGPEGNRWRAATPLAFEARYVRVGPS